MCLPLFLPKSDFEKAKKIHAQASSESVVQKIYGIQSYAIKAPSTACPSLPPACTIHRVLRQWED